MVFYKDIGKTCLKMENNLSSKIPLDLQLDKIGANGGFLNNRFIYISYYISKGQKFRIEFDFKDTQKSNKSLIIGNQSD